MKRKRVCEIDESLGNGCVDKPSIAIMVSNLLIAGSPESWLRLLRTAKKQCSHMNNTRRVHYEFENGIEMLEEYNVTTSCLSRRAWKTGQGNTARTASAEPEWIVEIGEPPLQKPLDSNDLRESNDQPTITRRNTKNVVEWRIRNLPYPIDVYSVEADTSEKCIIVRTSNKKYYKKLTIPELNRIGMMPIQSNIEYAHKFNTLIISYKKPVELTKLEKTWWEELCEIKGNDNPIDECKPS